VSALLSRWSAIGFAIGLFTVLSYGCVVPGVGYGYGDAIGLGLDYYEPYGVNYGGWGPGYQVAPFRGGAQRPATGGGRASPHAYRSAPASRSVPSIPSASRSGAGRHR